jgi:hypothetical protein
MEFPQFETATAPDITARLMALADLCEILAAADPKAMEAGLSVLREEALALATLIAFHPIRPDGRN